MISEFFFSEPLNLLFVLVDVSSDDAEINISLMFCDRNRLSLCVWSKPKGAWSGIGDIRVE